MPRPVLEEAHIHSAVRELVASHHADTVSEVQAALAQHAVVVVGMRGNPFVRRARQSLNQSGVAHHNIELGGYLSQWRKRNALKMWTGWPTLPMVFVKGTLVGGATDLQRLIDSGELQRLLA